MKNVDVVVVGLGLAGTVLAITLLRRGHTVAIFDDPEEEKSSLAAAGLFNPVTGRKMVRTWKADELWPELTSFYTTLERDTGSRFFYTMPQYRPFLDKREMIGFANGELGEDFQSYIEQMHLTPRSEMNINDTFGGLSISATGFLDMKTFLASAKAYLKKHCDILEERVNDSEIQPFDHHVEVKGIHAGKLLFANGWKASREGFFSWLPFSPVKGEVLKAKNDGNFRELINRGVFILPHVEGDLRIGSTYDHSDLTTSVTEEAKNQLIRKYKGLIGKDPEITDQWAGIRPATQDRRPFIGFHPEHGTIGLFNGLGTKGVSLAPYFARQLAKFIEGECALDPEVTIERYYSLYLSQK